MTQILIDGLCFAEGPRWRDNHLWLSDMHAQHVLKVDKNGHKEVVVNIDDDQPSGIGWLPSGELLIVSMTKRQVLKYDGKLSVHADLSEHASYYCNDMVVDQHGRAYVGNFGFDLHSHEQPKPAELILVQADGSVSVENNEVMFPNGTIISADGKTLVVGESYGGCLTAFDVGTNGHLSNKRTWANLPEGAVPDGICLDEEGGIWCASPTTNECLRIVEGGQVTHSIATDNMAIACILGGNKLYLLTSSSTDPDECKLRQDAKVEVYDAPFAGAGWP